MAQDRKPVRTSPTTPWFWQAVALGGLIYSASQGWIPGPVPASVAPYVRGAALILGALLVWHLSGVVLRAWASLQRIIESHRPSIVHGSARFADRADLIRARLHDQQDGLWIGVYDDVVLRYRNETHTLVIASAGSGKTVDDVIMQLGTVDMPMLITDMKGELYWVSARFREWRFGHRIVVINPPKGAPHAGDSYNVCDLVLDALAHDPRDALLDAAGIALQLHPEPVKSDGNVFFRNGARQIVSFTIVATAILSPEECNLPCVHKIVTDTRIFIELCRTMKEHPALNGDVAAMAQSLLSTYEDTPKHFADFRSGAIQALAGFASSGRLAALTERSTFRFRDLKLQGQMSVYINFDMTRMQQFKKLAALFNWAAMIELQRAEHPRCVMIMMDEASNFPILELPNYLTALRGYGIQVFMVFQEVEEIRRVYSDTAVATIFGQCDVIKAYGLKSIETLKRFSEMCGKTTVATGGFNLGQAPGDMASQSRNYSGRDLITPHEIQGFKSCEQIVFIKGLDPLICGRVGYHEVEPLRSAMDANPMHGGTRYQGAVHVELEPRPRVLRPIKTKQPPRQDRVWPRVLWTLLLMFWGRLRLPAAPPVAMVLQYIPVRLVIVLGLAGIIWFWGMPQPLVEQRPQMGRMMQCRYMGWDLELRRAARLGACAWVRFEPVPDWVWDALGLTDWRRAYS